MCSVRVGESNEPVTGIAVLVNWPLEIPTGTSETIEPVTSRPVASCVNTTVTGYDDFNAGSWQASLPPLQDVTRYVPLHRPVTVAFSLGVVGLLLPHDTAARAAVKMTADERRRLNIFHN